MRLNRNDIVTFVDPKTGKTIKGAAIRYDVRPQEIVVKVFGEPFRWEGGPLGEELDSKGNLIPGKVGYSDSIWVISVANVVSVTPAVTMRRRNDIPVPVAHT